MEALVKKAAGEENNTGKERLRKEAFISQLALKCFFRPRIS